MKRDRRSPAPRREKPQDEGAVMRRRGGPRRALSRPSADAEGHPLPHAGEGRAIAPEPLRLSLVQLNAASCRWPIGDPRLPGFCFCGGEAARPSPYCDYHSGIAYQDVTGGKAAAERAARRDWAEPRPAARGSAVRSAALAGLAALVLAHSWYPPACCSERDCAPLAAERVRAGAAGWELPGGVVVPYGQAKASPDGRFHWCRRPSGALICFFAPAMGV